MHPLLIHLAKAQLHFGRGCYIESKLPVATAVSHKKEIISSSTVDDMVKFIHCNIGNGHCKVERQQQSVDVEFTVACDICEIIVYKLNFVQRHSAVALNTLLYVFHSNIKVFPGNIFKRIHIP